MRVHFEMKCYFMCFLSERKHLLIFNVQLYLLFERVPVTLKFPLHSAIVTIVQKSSIMVMDNTDIRHYIYIYI